MRNKSITIRVNVSRIFDFLHNDACTTWGSSSDDEELEEDPLSPFEAIGAVLAESTLCGSTTFVFTRHDQIN